MTPDIPKRDFEPGQPLCINRKIHNSEIKVRQAAFVDRFAQGCNGAMVSSQEAALAPIEHPYVIRGMKFTAAVNLCWQTGRTFYYIDNGYIGNVGRKVHFRIIKDHVHDIRPIIERPRDRLDQLYFTMKRFSTGSKILVAPPSEKSFSLWNINQQQWIDETVAEIKQHTDRPIEIRSKINKKTRTSLYQTLLDGDYYCTISINSNSAIESVWAGVPAITLDKHVSNTVTRNSLSQINDLYYGPLGDWLAWLSYCQFTYDELMDGTALSIIREYHSV